MTIVGFMRQIERDRAFLTRLPVAIVNSLPAQLMRQLAQDCGGATDDDGGDEDDEDDDEDEQLKSDLG